jgi:hypothetical protein
MVNDCFLFKVFFKFEFKGQLTNVPVVLLNTLLDAAMQSLEEVEPFSDREPEGHLLQVMACI